MLKEKYPKMQSLTLNEMIQSLKEESPKKYWVMKELQSQIKQIDT